MLRRFVFTVAMVTVAMVLSLPFQNAFAQTTTNSSQIETVVREYFDLLHEGRNALSTQDFSHLVASTPDAVDFLKAEEDKREVEYYQAQLFKLNYIDASFQLDLYATEISDSAQSAIVRVDEWQEIVFEVSSPVVSKSHIEHTFSLILEDNEWRIVSDDYLDPVRQFLDVTGYSKDEAIQSLDSQYTATQGEAEIGSLAVMQGGYNAAAAVSYAHTYYASYNVPEYTDFAGADCTNFVSQAIGDADQGAAVPQDYHSNGWYYTDVYNRAPAWTSVPSLYTFITSTSKLSGYTGPEGNSTTVDGVTSGDVIQYSSSCNTYWNHSIIIVGYSGGHLVASHDPDVDNYPYTSIAGCRRYIHITGY